MFSKFLKNISDNLIWWIGGALLAGLAYVKFFGGYAFTSLICLLAALIMIYPSMVPLSFVRLKDAIKKKKIILISLGLNFLFAPAAAFLMGMIFLKEYPALWIGLMLIALLPGGGMATTWALKSKSDMPTAIGIIFSNLLVAILVVPFSISFFMQRFIPKKELLYKAESCSLDTATKGIFSCASGEINPMKIAMAMFLIVIVPLFLAFMTQLFVKKNKGTEYFEKIKGFFGKFSNFGLILVLFFLMSLESNTVLFSNPKMIVMSFLPVAIFYALYFLVVYQAYSFLGKSDEAKSLVWGSYLRYITLALGISMSLVYQNPELSLTIVPIIIAYFIQIPSSVFISRNFEKIINK